MWMTGRILASVAFGWSCQSVNPTPVNLNVSVFQTAQNVYELHVMSVQGSPEDPVLTPILTLESVAESTRDNFVIYTGQSGMAQAELSIERLRSGYPLPGTLKMLRNDAGPNDPLGTNSTSALTCSPTRKSP
jgi:hypothetical protein